MGRRGLASVALTMLALALLGVGVTALAWWPESSEQSDSSRPATARVVQSVPCGGQGGQGDLVEVRSGGKPTQQRFDGCGHSPGEQLQVLLPKKPGGKVKPAESESGTGGGQRLMWVLLTVAAVAGGGYALLLPHLRQSGAEEAGAAEAPRERRSPQVAPRRTRGPRLPDDHPSGPNPAPLDPDATMPPVGSTAVGPASLPPEHPSGPIPSPLDPNATMPPTGPDAKLPSGHPSGPNPLPIDPDASTLPPTGGPSRDAGQNPPPQSPNPPQPPNSPQPPDQPPQVPNQPPSQPPQSSAGSGGPVPPTARGPVPHDAGGVDEPVPPGFRPDGFAGDDPVPADPDDEPRGRKPGEGKQDKPGKPGKSGKSDKPSKIEQLKEARRKRKENPFDFA